LKGLTFQLDGYRAETQTRDEALFHCANGYLGVRGSFEEGAPMGAETIRGTYINGFSENEDICYGERLYGFPSTKQVLVNLPDAQGIRLYADGKMAACWDGEAENVRRSLDFSGGCSVRSFRWTTRSGALDITVTRMASFVRRELFLIRYGVTSVGFSGEITLDSTLNGDVYNFSDPNDPRVASETEQKFAVVRRMMENDRLGLLIKTIRSERVAGCVVLHEMDGKPLELMREGNELAARFTRSILPGETLTLTKYCVYTDAPEKSDVLAYAASLAGDAAKKGYAFWQAEQRDYLRSFWERSRITIQGDEQTQAYLDLCLYEVLCAAGQNGRSSVAAKGLSGEGYEGHYFWDCETYVFPFFLASAPDMARKLLDYRYTHLEAARVHARMMGHERGALFPWRTITGSECSSYYPSGSAQYHINADIAHAFCQYWYATREEDYLPNICEVLVETARLFFDVGHMEEDGFHIDGVTGPDEYTCIVNNNYYTNAGAAYTFAEAVKLCKKLKECGGFEALSKKTGVTKGELDAFWAAGEAMYLPYDEARGICKQDDSFLSKKRWDIRSIPPENFPLLLHYHPLFINRHQICKQADTVLANLVFREEPPLMMTRTYHYYEAVTTHDSSLSACVYSIMAARLGDLERAVRYFNMTVGIDTQDHSGNTRDGLHIANMGGAYLSIVYGFGGIRILPDGVYLFPLLPGCWNAYSFQLTVRGSRVTVSVDRDGCTLSLIQGDAVELNVFDRKINVTKETTLVQRTVRGVLFDLDGVVTDTARYHYAAWKRIADELDIPFDERKNERFKGVSRAACMDMLLEMDGRAMPQAERQAWMNRKNKYYLEALESLTPKDILPGIRDCMRKLTGRGIPFALFSVSKNTDFILDKLGLQSAFSTVVTGNDIARSKPHFEGYLLAAERLEIDPRLCLMVEDAMAGLIGAKNVSMRTIGVGQSLPDGCADAIVEDTTELWGTLKGFVSVERL
jgi:alpha,alpha-trehalose phosphorylase